MDAAVIVVEGRDVSLGDSFARLIGDRRAPAGKLDVLLCENWKYRQLLSDDCRYIYRRQRRRACALSSVLYVDY